MSACLSHADIRNFEVALARAWHSSLVEIRPIRESDRQGYIDLYEATAAEGRWIGGELPVNHAELSARVDRALTLDNVAIFVAEAQVDGVEAQIGHLGLVLSAGIVEFGMMVAPGHRGAGVGKLFLAELISWAEQNDAHKVMLEVWPHNDRARALYESAGFEIEGTLVKHYRRNNGELWDCLLMGLVLERK